MLTVVVPVSPIKSHPDTSVLTETLDSVRHHLPDAELIVTFDGVRPEQESRREAYEEHIRRMLWRLDHHYGNACPFVWDEHLHQVGMLRRVIDEIRTPYMLWMEQDTPLVTSEPIDWAAILDFLDSGESNSIRFHHESRLLEAHSHLVHGADRGGLFTRTSQYSARPHVASVAFYRRLLNYFTPGACSFLEDKLHGVCSEAYLIDGMSGWNQMRLHLYTPDGNIQRSSHLDGRAGEPKFAETQRF